MAQEQLNFGGIPRRPDAPVAGAEAATPDPDQLNFEGIPKPAPAAGRGSAVDPRQSLSVTRRMAEGFDPRTPAGRANLATTAVGLGTAYATGGGSTAPWIARILAPGILPAGTAAVAEAAEQVAGTKPVSTSAVATEAALQPAYEYGPRALFWLPRRVASAFLAGPIARRAGHALREGVEAARTTATENLDAIREQGRQFVETVRRAARGDVRGLQQQLRTDLRTQQRAASLEVARSEEEAAGVISRAEDAARARVAGTRTATRENLQSTRAAARGELEGVRAAHMAERAELERLGQEELGELQRLYAGLESAPPNPLEVAGAVKSVVSREAPRGPAQKALDLAGAAVGEAAASGPPLAVAPLKDALDEMVRTARPDAIFAKPDATGMIGFLRSIGAREAPAGAAASLPTSAKRLELQQKIQQELKLVDQHPLPGILAKVAALPEGGTLSFADAHALKRLLDETVTWDQASKKHIAQITKGLRETLRESMAVHQPYNQATAAYADAVNLYRRGVGKRLITAATEDPDKVVRLLDAKNPDQAAQIKRLLVDQSAAGGDPALGAKAWQAVQAAYTHQHIILGEGGIRNLSQRVAKVLTQSPEFAKVVYGDEVAQRVLTNLDELGQAFRAAEENLKSAVANQAMRGQAAESAVKTSGVDRVRAAREQGASAVEAARLEAEALKKGARATADTYTSQAREITTQQLQQTRDTAAERLRTARDTASDRVRGARAAADATTRAAAREGRAEVDQAVGRVRQFRESKVGGVEQKESPSVDALYLATLGPSAYVGARSIMRLLQSPSADELAQWIAYSPQLTQLTVRALQSRLPDAAAAGLVRDLMSLVSAGDPAAAFREPTAQPAQSRPESRPPR